MSHPHQTEIIHVLGLVELYPQQMHTSILLFMTLTASTTADSRSLLSSIGTEKKYSQQASTYKKHTEIPSFANKFGLKKDSPGTQLNFSILFIFTPLSFERSSSCSGVIIPSSSAVHIQWPCRDLNPGHLTCEASVLPLLHQCTLNASEFSRLNRRNVFTLERCDWCARSIERRPSNCPGCDDRLSRQLGLPSQVA
ncbi:hypothetical protein CSKR_108911 [Clonorchis sinensis]|uniref:Uncharacterized protein n=1 Tax=Clonorchis sinensis TaxID=79923 RepID=A0A419PDH7_CLOSI|nr:hypothetical protein CSKR_108911 [Clonorchis sinensis]